MQPITPAGPAGPVFERSSGVDKQALRVLVVEDERLIRWAIGETLAGKGYTVVEACDAASARQIMHDTQEPVDVVLLDYRLPDSNDFQLLDDLHRLSPASVVVIMTAQNDPALTAAALDHGACRVLDKPFDLRVLHAAVREASAGGMSR
jgi:DNA-binding NtrC family response regulator